MMSAAGGANINFKVYSCEGLISAVPLPPRMASFRNEHPCIVLTNALRRGCRFFYASLDKLGYTLYILNSWRVIMQVVVQKWGNSLGFRIPSFWAKDNDVKNGSKVEVIAEKGKMIILPQKKSLEDIMNLVTDENLHSEIETFEAVGKEAW